MKWFKHDTDANQDAKLQNVLLDYGLEGYGLYWYCIELIAGKVDQNNLNFDLEHDARIIARNTGSTVCKVEEMMRYFTQQELFENAGGAITCAKLLKRLDKSMTSNNGLRKAIDDLKNSDESHDKVMTQSALSHDSVMIKPDLVMQEKNRIEKKRKEQNRKEQNSKDMCVHEIQFEKVWSKFPTKLNKKKAKALWWSKTKSKDHFSVADLADQLIADIDKRCELQQFGFDKMHFTTYLNGERFNDEYSQPAKSTGVKVSNMEFF